MTIDVGEHISKFLQNKLGFKEIFFDFYIYFIPYIIALLGPYFVFITVIYFTSQLAGKSEIIAMFNSGMSFKRFLAPYIFTSFLLAGFMWYTNNYLVPNTNKKRLAFENKYIAYQSPMSSDHVHRRIDDSTYFYIRVYDNNIHTAHTVSVEKIIQGKLVKKTLAEKGIWDDLTKSWTFYNYFERDLSQAKEVLTKGDSIRIHISLDPTILIKRWTHIEELNRDEIKEKINDLKLQGAENTTIYELELYRRTSKCFGIIILTIIGATLASKKIRGGMGLHLMAGITLSSAFELIQKFVDTFAINANLAPLIAVWIPNVLYFIIAILLWKKYQE